MIKYQRVLKNPENVITLTSNPNCDVCIFSSYFDEPRLVFKIYND